MNQIEIGVKYTPAHPDWAHVIADLREGDEVEVWFGAVEGHRGALHEALVNGFRGLKIAGVFVRLHEGSESRLTELTVTKLAPRKPDWWGAEVIRCVNGIFIYRPVEDRYQSSLGGRLDPDHWYMPDEVTVILDADGNLTWDAVEAEFSERIYDGIRDGLAGARTLLVSELPPHVMTGIRASCGGDNK